MLVRFFIAIAGGEMNLAINISAYTFALATTQRIFRNE